MLYMYSICTVDLPAFQSDDAINSERMYDLFAVVVHCGSGPNRGHYISIVKSHGFWLLFDDDIVDVRLISKRVSLFGKNAHI